MSEPIPTDAELDEIVLKLRWYADKDSIRERAAAAIERLREADKAAEHDIGQYVQIVAEKDAEIDTLRAMQGKEQESAATPSKGTGGPSHEGAGGSAADPPASEDGLLAAAKRIIRDCNEVIEYSGVSENAFLLTRVRELISLMRDRIAADARLSKLLAKDRDKWRKDAGEHNKAASELDAARSAAEARAQGLEADARRYRWLQTQFCGREPDHLKAHREEKCYLDLNPADLDAAIDSAALAPDSGKERG